MKQVFAVRIFGGADDVTGFQRIQAYGAAYHGDVRLSAFLIGFASAFVDRQKVGDINVSVLGCHILKRVGRWTISGGGSSGAGCVWKLSSRT